MICKSEIELRCEKQVGTDGHGDKVIFDMFLIPLKTHVIAVKFAVGTRKSSTWIHDLNC